MSRTDLKSIVTALAEHRDRHKRSRGELWTMGMDEAIRLVRDMVMRYDQCNHRGGGK